MRTLSELVKTAGSVAGGPAVSEESVVFCAKAGRARMTMEIQAESVRRIEVMSLPGKFCESFTLLRSNARAAESIRFNQDHKINHK